MGVLGPFLDELPEAAPLSAPDDLVLSGALSRQDLVTDVQLELLDFNLVCSPARARLLRGGAPITAAGQPVELALHHVPSLVKVVRDDEVIALGEPIPVRGALVLDLDLATLDDPADRAALEALFGERIVVDFVGTASRTSLDLLEIRRAMSGRVPYREKGVDGELIGLTAGGDRGR